MQDDSYLADDAECLDPVLMAAAPELALELAHDFHFLSGRLSNSRAAHLDEDVDDLHVPRPM